MEWVATHEPQPSSHALRCPPRPRRDASHSVAWRGCSLPTRPFTFTLGRRFQRPVTHPPLLRLRHLPDEPPPVLPRRDCGRRIRTPAAARGAVECVEHLHSPPSTVHQQPQHRCPGGSSSPRHLTHHRAATPRNPATSLLSHLTLTLARQRPLTIAEPHHPRADARSAVLPSTSPLPAQATSQSLALMSAITRRRPHTCRVAPLCHTARS